MGLGTHHFMKMRNDLTEKYSLLRENYLAKIAIKQSCFEGQTTLKNVTWRPLGVGKNARIASKLLMEQRVEASKNGIIIL